MNDRYEAGYGDDGYGGDQYEIVGYDDYGRPVYQQVPSHGQQPRQQPQQQTYDPYGQQQGYAQGGYDTGQQQPIPPGYDPYGTQQAPYDPYGTGAQQPRVTEQTAYIPQQTQPDDDARTEVPPAGSLQTGEGRQAGEDGEFAFVEEPDGDSEDVIDWLKFTENRTERREEARRRARGRIIALGVVLTLVVAGGVGYLWYDGKLPGVSSPGTATGTTVAAGAQKRDVIVVHLHDTGRRGTSTVLLVDNTTTRRGTTVLLPNSLALTDDSGTTTTLAKSVDDDGSSGTRDQLDTVLGTDIQGTWRLDTPYLQNLVELVGNIEIDTDTDVPDPDAKKKGAAPLVHRGSAQTLSGKMAVAYATYRGPGETENAQLKRFGEVMQGALRKLSSDPSAATTTVQTLAQILDPPLTDKDLGTFLAKLADLAKDGKYQTVPLPVQSDGTLSAGTSDSVVKNILGGTAKSPDAGSAVRVAVQNATGAKDDTEKARVTLLGGGFGFIEGGTASGAQAASKVVYSDPADKQNATEVAKTLGLSAAAVSKGAVSSGADVLVVLGQDYRPAAS
ncbi:LytR family transcriptional regulator [Streptomyces seoulensis]|uniref:LytR family transcriptional regulator n=1 Tax=Streptomyces seoulensis TaxID=73044 RepID=A0A4P6TUI7_STRSO|nr:LCP family protein [Streptomyces seoulensis]QBJ90487.1 LytR family transcriptional regulator [Streptomyces seoulensis]